MDDCLKQDVHEADFIFALSLYVDLLVRGKKSGVIRGFRTTSARSIAQSRPDIWSVWLMILFYTYHVSSEQWIPSFGLTYLVALL